MGGGQATRLGLSLREPLPWSALVEVARTAEDTAYEAVFVPEIAGRESFATLAALAEATDRLSLGTGVVTIAARSPVLTAMAAGTVHELSGGRLILGVGAGSRASAVGVHSAAAWDHPLDRTRAFLRLVRATLAGGEVRAGPPYPVAGFRSALSLDTIPPVWLAALGDRMVALAGEEADGALLNICTPERVRQARALAREAAAGAGRDPADVTIAVYVRACLLGTRDDLALDALRAAIGAYVVLPPYRRQFEAMELSTEAEAAAKAMEAGRPVDVPAELVDAVAVRGGRAEWEARLGAYRAAGADLVVVYPVPAGDPVSSLIGTVLAAAPATAVER
ncbi:MAG TPA: LLM class flavin-dependent oxidoreductase [Actinomycetota bacterium]|nr:LLM class flavin-dependent oxidoreductase [Actinomycetota bacterium]